MQNYTQDDPYEREPLDSRAYHQTPPSRRPMPPSHAYSQPASPYHDSSPHLPPQYQPEPAPYGRHHDQNDYERAEPQYAGSSSQAYGGAAAYGADDYADRSPAPPRHGDNSYYSGGGVAPNMAHDNGYGYRGAQTNITPEADNFSASAAGGMAGVAYNVADQNPRESGMNAMRGDYGQHAQHGNYGAQGGQLPPPPSRTHYPTDPYASGGSNAYERGYDPHGYGHGTVGRDSNSNLAAIGGSRAQSRSPSHFGSEYDNPFSTPRGSGPRLGHVDPNDIADDGDDGLNYHRPSNRNSMLSSHNSDRGRRAGLGGAAAAGGAVAAGGLMARGGNRGSAYDLSGGPEKPSDWMAKKQAKSKRWKWIIIGLVAFVIIGAIVGGTIGGLYGNKGGGSGGGSSNSGQSAEEDEEENGDLGKNSAEIKALLNNSDLHKVFPGMDYTPINTQYPYCIHDPPSQNNVTRDVAVLSQLTNKIRLYGTDCNQTQMLIHAIERLGLENEVKVWLGVWQDGNETTNSRQLEQMWDILDEYGEDPFEGIIVANEILFREEMTITQLATILDGVRTNLSNKDINLPVATSDLGDDWTQELADDSDYLMANIHPFFAGVDAADAASWTYSFWQNKNSGMFKSDDKKNIIAEVGWPTGGGTNCGGASSCTDGSVAGVDGLNTLMEDWVCQALENGTEYFWFSSFDEPWKERFNTDGKRWEDKWGLMDVNRNLKDGVKIPDCGGKTI